MLDFAFVDVIFHSLEFAEFAEFAGYAEYA
jgi:hypothetical protein